jgi:hypothetical protein
VTPPAVLVAPLADRARHELEATLGTQDAAAIGATLEADAQAWAHEIEAGRPHVCPPEASLLEEVRRIAGEAAGPLVIVWPALARLRRDHGQAALDDLAEGCDVVFGPLVDGGLYLLGFQRLLPLVVDLLEGDVQPDGFAAALSVAAESGLEIGYLRPERSLASRDGVALALADPLTPAEIRAALTPH